ncbi:unnamed protein product [Fraxinus pennsylvanica]|uniref:NADH-ubiquinone oxidoreductase chain 6 n=5 Tax=Oleaceae TaxID=4144 RepID=A0AAD2E5S9_9LAMI|nr:unnamed protein product [Fraxinus pennsylvanica]
MHRRTKRSYIPFLLNPETRSDVIPVRLHFRETIPQARQPISHRRVCVNNRMVNITHFKVSHGDIISFQENDARTRGEEIRRSFYIEISVEKIIGKFLDRPVRMWRRTKTEWFRKLKTKKGCRLLLKSQFLQQLRSSMQEEDTKKFGSKKGPRTLKGGGEGSRTSNQPRHIKNSRRRERFEIPEGRRTMILSVLSSPALVSGLMVVRAKNPVHSVLFPIPVFRNTSGLLLLLGLDFFAMIFPVVYIGAIAVSFLFVVMMFNIQIAEIHEEVLRYLPVSGIIGLIFWWEMFFILDNESIPLLPTQRNTTSLRYTVYAEKVRSWTNLETLGNLLYTYYSVWFLVPSLILLVAMIGAIVLTMHRTTKVKRQDVFRRNAIDSRRTIMRRTTDPLTIY